MTDVGLSPEAPDEIADRIQVVHQALEVDAYLRFRFLADAGSAALRAANLRNTAGWIESVTWFGIEVEKTDDMRTQLLCGIWGVARTRFEDPRNRTSLSALVIDLGFDWANTFHEHADMEEDLAEASASRIVRSAQAG